ncbi:hypothetical protein SAMN05216359_11955 [Roseateles sp. YR242]|uniref:hypothetical protein n=1 Tax=Roseateles sp. YR242 TaxID=1855305 RepID=UPI0008B91CF9|nr:hypothetical protein [Roseateles sp. YR242]SEL84711.1 hypothetical protein SAMN05216359_11955 [Roseateles sp. YR242]
MRHRFANHPVALQHHQFSLVMQRILRQTEVLMQRRQAAAGGQANEPEHPSLDGLEVTESTWDDWAEAMSTQEALR